MGLYEKYLKTVEKCRGLTMKNGAILNETLAEAIFYYLENEWGYKNVNINDVKLTISPSAEVVYLVDYSHVKNGKIANGTAFYNDEKRKRYKKRLLNTHIGCITDLEYRPWKGC